MARDHRCHRPKLHRNSAWLALVAVSCVACGPGGLDVQVGDYNAQLEVVKRKSDDFDGMVNMARHVDDPSVLDLDHGSLTKAWQASADSLRAEVKKAIDMRAKIEQDGRFNQFFRFGKFLDNAVNADNAAASMSNEPLRYIEKK